MKKKPAIQEPSETEIQHLAYHLWLEGGCQPGRDRDHWFAARKTLQHRITAASKTRAPRGPVTFPPHNLGPTNPPFTP